MAPSHATHSHPAVTTHVVGVVDKKGTVVPAQVLSRRPGGVYVHYVNEDKRLDEWVDEQKFTPDDPTMDGVDPSAPTTNGDGRRRRRMSSVSMDERVQVNGGEDMTEEEYDIQHHKQITAQRNFDKVVFGNWQIKTWYFSPYPLTDTEIEAEPAFAGTPSAATRIPGVNRVANRSHGRTSDLLAGGLGRSNVNIERSILWVCNKCFKYMADGVPWELHCRNCKMDHPPGRKVYQRGAHCIWEVDGAQAKLYCQNLSLFGKLFIDVKTLFFDCDNFLFYLLTDADSQCDYVIGFFSKEKVSYDDYNLACIITFPPWQRQRFGMLMIEFSYELSRRAGKVGTPERPLSDLGLRGYLAYWVSTIIRFLRRVLSVVPPEADSLVSIGSDLDLSRSPSRDSEHALRLQKRRNKGFAGEVTDPNVATAPLSYLEKDPIFTSLRRLETRANVDGSATTHVYIKCTLADIARATNLRIEDAAFALHECGLLLRRNGDKEICISREMVEAVARERQTKRMCMSLEHVLL